VDNQPQITVVIPNKGRANLCGMAIKSIKCQSLSNWEAIIVDDGSTPEELECIRAAIGSDPRISLVLRDNPPAGANHCRNIGVQRSRSDLLVFLDSDDMLSPNCLEARVSAMAKHPDLAFVVFAHEIFRDEPGDLEHAWQVCNDEDHLERFLIMYPPWQTAGPTWRRSTLDAVGPWDETLPLWQDWDYHVRALSLKPAYSIEQEPRFFSRVTGVYRESISSWRMRDVDATKIEQRVITKGYEQLRNKGLLTPRRELLLARLFLMSAENIAHFGQPEAAQSCWRRALELGLISVRRYREGLVLLRVHRHTLLRRTCRLYTRTIWPPLLRHCVTANS